MKTFVLDVTRELGDLAPTRARVTVGGGVLSLVDAMTPAMRLATLRAIVAQVLAAHQRSAGLVVTLPKGSRFVVNLFAPPAGHSAAGEGTALAWVVIRTYVEAFLGDRLELDPADVAVYEHCEPELLQ